MKKIYAILVLVLMCVTTTFAQTPEKLSYQAIVRNSSDAILANTNIGMQISILQGSANGTAVYVETQTPTTNTNGLVTIEIGTGSVLSGTFNNIDWSSSTYFIKTEIDPTGGSNYTITGTSQLMSVPYALHAKTAENITGSITETDPTYTASAANSITASDINNWNNKLSTEVDGSISNEIQNLEEILTENNDANGKKILNTGQIAIGTDSPNSSAALDINTTTGALLLPRITTMQRDALTPVYGMMIYNTDDKKFQGYKSEAGSILDQSQENQNDIFFNENTAQSFTAGVSGELSQVDVYLANSIFGVNDPNVTMTIRNGSGTSGTVLFTQGMPTITGSGLSWYSVAITGVNLVAGNQYTIHLTSTSFFDEAYRWGRDNTNPYGGGASYYSNTEVTTYDLCFRTYTNSGDGWINLH